MRPDRERMERGIVGLREAAVSEGSTLQELLEGLPDDLATAVFTHGAARASWLAGIGIGAGTATAVWGWANPGIASDAYRLGAARAICLRVAAGGFDDSVHTTFVSDQNAVTEAATKLTDAMTNGNFLDAGLKSTDGPTAASATKANDSAATAQQAATTAQAGASQELAIYQQRGALVYGALRKIDDQVYAAVKGSAITYQTTVTSINQAAATAPAPASGARAPVVVVQEPTNTASAIVAVSTRAQNLTSAAATLSAEKPFSSAATAVTACTTLTN